MHQGIEKKSWLGLSINSCRLLVIKCSYTIKKLKNKAVLIKTILCALLRMWPLITYSNYFI